MISVTDGRLQVASFLRGSTGQYVVISLKEQLYTAASAVLGIYSKVDLFSTC